MYVTRVISRSAAAVVVALSLGGTAWAQSTTGVPPKAKPQTSQPQTFKPAPQRSQNGFAGNLFSFNPLTDLFRVRRAPLVDYRTYRALERDRFGGDTIDPSGRYDSFFTAPETRPTQRLGQYPR